MQYPRSLKKQNSEFLTPPRFRFFSGLKHFIELWRSWPTMKSYAPMIKVSNSLPSEKQFSQVELDSCKTSLPSSNGSLDVVLKFKEGYSEVLLSQIRQFLRKNEISLSPVLDQEKEEGFDLTLLRRFTSKISVTSTIYSIKNLYRCSVTWNQFSLLLTVLRANKIDYNLEGSYLSDDNYPVSITVNSENQERSMMVSIGTWKPDFEDLILINQFTLEK